MNFNSQNLQSLLKDGSRHYTGHDVLSRNIEAVTSVSDITRTSMGPNGMNKMVVNHLNRHYVTHDAATILRELEVVHPAGKMVAQAAEAQQREVGDGTNLVIALAGALMAETGELLRMGLHPNDVIAGYAIGQREAIRIAEELIVETVKDVRDVQEVSRAMRAALSAKLSGYESTMARIVAEACVSVCPKKANRFNVDNVRVVKVPGGSVADSAVIDGFAIVRNPAGTIKHVKDARIAVFGCSVDASTMETKGTVMIKTADDLLNYNVSEENAMEREIKELAEAGVNVVVTQGSFGEMALHFLERYKIMAVRIPSKFQTRRLCRAVGATQLVRLGAPTKEEMGFCKSVSVREIGEQKVIVFSGPESGRTGLSTIVVRGATANVMDEVERAIDDGVNVYKTLTKDGRLVAGGGAFELEMYQRLSKVADETPGLEQYAIRKFAESFLVVPRTLSESAGHSVTEAVATLNAAHQAGKANIGVDIFSIDGRDVVEEGILDCYATKYWAIRLAASTVQDIISVDQIIMARPAGGPKKPPQQGHWDDQD